MRQRGVCFGALPNAAWNSELILRKKHVAGCDAAILSGGGSSGGFIMKSAKFVLGALALGIVASSVASAAPTRLLGVYEEEVTGNCANGAACTIYFSTTTKPLKVTKVSCNFYVRAQNVSLTGVELGHASEDKSLFKDGEFIAPIHTLLFGSNVTQFQFLADTLHVVPAHFRPSVQLGWDVGATSHFDCHIAGSET